MKQKPLKVYAGPRVADARYSAACLLGPLLWRVNIIFGHKASSLVLPPPRDAKSTQYPQFISFLLKSIGSFFWLLRNHDRYLHFLIECNFVVEKSKERDSSSRLRAIVSKDSLLTQLAYRFRNISPFPLQNKTWELFNMPNVLTIYKTRQSEICQWATNWADKPYLLVKAISHEMDRANENQ